MKIRKLHIVRFVALTTTFALMAVSTAAADRIEGRVEVSGVPIVGTEVTAWLAGPGAPKKLAAAQTNNNGSFDLTIDDGRRDAGVLYLVAEGGEAKTASGKGRNPAITLMATLGPETPQRVTISDLTTVASAWTGAQFLNGSAMSGNATGLRIAAGNVPNLVDLETGGLGPVVTNPLNGPETTTFSLVRSGAFP